MVGYCAAYGCNNSQKNRSEPGSVNRKDDITFHYFPKDPELCAKWTAALRRDNFKPSSTSRICSKHFKPTDFDDSGFRRKLIKGTIPSIFAFPDHLQRTETPRRSLVKHSPPPTKKKKLSTVECASYFVHDHGFYVQAPIDATTALQNAQEKVTSLKKELRRTKQKLNRKGKTADRLKDIIKQMRQKNLLEKSDFSVLTEAFGDMQCILFKHLVRSSKDKKFARRYTQKIKSFAVTLHYLSPKAYRFIRSVLNLPHPSTLRSWRSSVYCQPGFLDNMLQEASNRAVDEGSKLCSLIVDEMSIRRETGWCPTQHRFVGLVDYGGGPVSNTEASNALVFLLCGLKGHWKTPIAYFLTDHTDSDRLAESIKQAIIKAAEHGLMVKTVVADGLKANMKAGKLLGCDFFRPTNLKTSFPHPQNPLEQVYYICDPPHMLKLVRNLIGEWKELKSPQNSPIKWNYIVALHELQKRDSLYLANKLKSQHIFYNNVKMKVNIAAQTLSASVASAIDHLREDLQLPQFQGSEATCEFIRFFDKLFDALNGRNPYAKGFKAPLAKWNRKSWTEFLFHTVPSYLLALKDSNGRPIWKGPRNQGVLGFLISAKSTFNLATELIDSGKVDYLLPYKFSQDHIEMFFSKIRQRNGNNNNPSSEQFRWALRTLMLQNSVSASNFCNATGFCEEVDGHIGLLIQAKSPNEIECNENEDEEFAVEELEEIKRWITSPLFADLDWRQSCLIYTAGYVAKRLQGKIVCSRCVDALTMQDATLGKEGFSFLNRKNQGGLKKPSEGLVNVVAATEKAFRSIMPSPEQMLALPYKSEIDLHIQRLVFSGIKDKILSWFPSLADHVFDHEVGNDENHVSRLVKTISSFYVNMRLFKSGRLFHRRKVLQGKTSKRMKLNKLILFSGL